MNSTAADSIQNLLVPNELRFSIDGPVHIDFFNLEMESDEMKGVEMESNRRKKLETIHIQVAPLVFTKFSFQFKVYLFGPFIFTEFITFIFLHFA